LSSEVLQAGSRKDTERMKLAAELATLPFTGQYLIAVS
jgi:hypothetical protein